VRESPLPDLAVIGWPLTRTFSPPMQMAALGAAGLDWRYLAIPVPTDGLSEFLSRATWEMKGFNVTMPHKVPVLHYCSDLDPLAAASGAVNTVLCKGNRLEGHNTDGPGLVKALESRLGFRTKGSSVLILGAGGAASACAAALGQSGASKVVISNRTLSRAARVALRLEACYPRTVWAAVSMENLISVGTKAFDLVVNCLPEEASHVISTAVLEDARREGAVFCDLNYSNLPTRLESEARRIGYAIVPGLEVLLWQGVYGFEIFTGETAPVEHMKGALTSLVGQWWLER